LRFLKLAIHSSSGYFNEHRFSQVKLAIKLPSEISGKLGTVTHESYLLMSQRERERDKLIIRTNTYKSYIVFIWLKQQRLKVCYIMKGNLFHAYLGCSVVCIQNQLVSIALMTNEMSAKKT
jgi:hypothetical protein